MRRPLRAAALACACALAAAMPARAGAGSPFLEELTWSELRARIDAGTTVALVPIGGTEQNGPHMVLGKHNARARALAGRIAERLGNAVVAPVVAYVPEGAIDPPAGHMRFAGTLSVPESAFEATLEGAARSLRHHGFRQIVLLGDHGGYRRSLERVAAKLNREWKGAAELRALPEYYRASQDEFAHALLRRGYTAAEIGEHAGLGDTALALAIDPSLVRRERLADAAGASGGVRGDPRRATPELGAAGVEHIVEATVQAIRRPARQH